MRNANEREELRKERKIREDQNDGERGDPTNVIYPMFLTPKDSFFSINKHSK